MVAPHLLHDLTGQPLRPAITWEREEEGRGQLGVICLGRIRAFSAWKPILSDIIPLLQRISTQEVYLNLFHHLLKNSKCPDGFLLLFRCLIVVLKEHAG